MPLDREHERVAGCDSRAGEAVRWPQLGSFDDAVRGARARDKAGAELVDGLVVMGRHGKLGLAEYGGQQRTGGHSHVVAAVAGGLGRVAFVADHAGQVLVQGAAQRHVDHLQSATDAQQRQPAGQRATAQVQFGSVAVQADGPALWFSRRSVQGWVEVAATRQHHAVQPV